MALTSFGVGFDFIWDRLAIAYRFQRRKLKTVRFDERKKTFERILRTYWQKKLYLSVIQRQIIFLTE